MESKTGRKGDENTSNRTQPGGTKDDVAMGGTSLGSKGNAKGKLTDTKLHNAVLKTLCACHNKFGKSEAQSSCAG